MHDITLLLRRHAAFSRQPGQNGLGGIERDIDHRVAVLVKGRHTIDLRFDVTGQIPRAIDGKGHRDQADLCQLAPLAHR